MSNNHDSYNRGGFYAFIFSMVFSVLFFIYLIFLHPGVNMKEAKDVAESNMKAEAGAQSDAKTEKEFDLKSVENPWVFSEEMAAAGKQAFAQNCAACHGPNGDANTPVAKTMSPPPRNLVKGDWTKGGTSKDLFEVLAKGIEGTSMASFSHLDLNTRWALVHFIRSITKNKVADDASALEDFGKSAK